VVVAAKQRAAKQRAAKQRAAARRVPTLAVEASPPVAVAVAAAVRPSAAVAAVVAVVTMPAAQARAAARMQVMAAAVAAVVAVAVEVEVEVVEERGSRAAGAVRAPKNRRSSLVESVHSGTLPCLRRGSSSRLVANIRSPATSFWRVSAGSITSSM
jgi:hypothetical protein